MSDVLDAGAEWAIGSFALWTVLYHVSLATGLGPSLVFNAWLVGSAAFAVARFRLRGRIPRIAPGSHPAAALAVAALFGLASSVIVRPDLDDASYTVRSTWVAAHGTLDVGDVIFSSGRWPALPEQTPYLPSVESLFGWLARATGLPAGDVVYSLYVPVASFAAIWALWMLLRVWRARRPALALVLASVFLLWGGGTNASWGNLHLARIWQGKVTLLAVLVPLAYAWIGRYWAASTPVGRLAALVPIGVLGVASVGLSPAATFVVPAVMAVATTVGLVTRRVRSAIVVGVVGAAYPIGAGIVTKLAGHTNAAIPGPGQEPWVRTLGSGVPALVVLAGAALAVAGVVAPRLARCCDRDGQLIAAVAVLAGALIAVPAVYAVATAIMGTDAIAWRLTWVVPVPALVGMVACLPESRFRVPALILPVIVATALIVGGIPLWSSSNGASVAAPGAWKMSPQDLATARWIAAQKPEEPYLAREQVVAAVGTITAELRPVGSRPSYIAAYDTLPGSMSAARELLQRWVDLAPRPGDVGHASESLDALGATIVCAPPAALPLTADGWHKMYSTAADVCWMR